MGCRAEGNDNGLWANKRKCRNAGWVECWVQREIKIFAKKGMLVNRATDLHHFDVDPDPSFHFFADPDPTFHF